MIKTKTANKNALVSRCPTLTFTS